MHTVDMQVTLLDHMGSDLTVVNAARVSFAKESKQLGEKDERLINYLATHNHWTVFGHCFTSFRIKAPIFVARQLVKHQVGLVWNEESRRYIDSEPEFWFPDVLRSRPEGSIKQGSGTTTVDEMWLQALHEHIKPLLTWYNSAIEAGVAPEQARMALPLNTMTEWVWSGSLAAWARICKLRLDPHAQQETRMIAEKIYCYMSALYPISWNALCPIAY